MHPATYVKVFALVAAWDWLVAVSTRLLADESLAAVPLAVALTAFWWVGSGIAARGNRLAMAAAVAGAAVGTTLGVGIPVP